MRRVFRDVTLVAVAAKGHPIIHVKSLLREVCKRPDVVCVQPSLGEKTAAGAGVIVAAFHGGSPTRVLLGAPDGAGAALPQLAQFAGAVWARLSSEGRRYLLTVFFGKRHSSALGSCGFLEFVQRPALVDGRQLGARFWRVRLAGNCKRHLATMIWRCRLSASGVAGVCVLSRLALHFAAIAARLGVRASVLTAAAFTQHEVGNEFYHAAAA